MIVGLDEVGRGCWAGPVVAGAVVLKRAIPGLRDSKKLTKLQREKLDTKIRRQAIGFGIGWVSVGELDEMGMTAAVSLAMQRALEQIDTSLYDEVIIDGNYNYLKERAKTPVQTLVKADDKVPAVSAASIIAKVARDKWMATEAATQFPQYKFESHVGYGTPGHAALLKLHGACDLHRKSFRPVQLILETVVAN